MKNELAKKIDKSLIMDGRFTIPNDNLDMFLQGKKLECGDSKEVTIIFKKKKYSGLIRHVDQEKSKTVYQMQWEKDKELQLALKKEFVQSYIAILSDMYKKIKSSKKYRTELEDGVQEVIKIIEVGKNEFEIKSFIKIKSPYSNLFQRLIENNVFAWIDKESDESSLIIKETEWMDISKLPEHVNERNVIYYLADEKNKKIYIGSAKKLGQRVEPGRSIIPGWNKFRYEIINPDYSNMLRLIEYHAINNFARFIENRKYKNPSKKIVNNLMITDYKMVNKDIRPR